MSLLQEYKNGLKSVAVEEVFDLVFYRPLAFVLVKLIYSTSVTPNQLTILSMFFGLFGGASYAFGTPLAYGAGGVFYLLYNIIDCSDGQLARLKHNGTPIGRVLDGVADYVVSIAAYVGIGIGYAGSSDHPGLLWCLTAAAMISNAIQSGLLDFYRARYLDITLDRVSILVDEQKAFESEYAALKNQNGHYFERALIWIYLTYSVLQRRVTAGGGTPRVTAKVDPVAYERENRALIRWWTFLGPTTQWTLLIICSFLTRLDIYLWAIAGLGNVMAVVLSAVQRRKDQSMNMRGIQ
jgi:hypothetical protein